MSNTPSRCELVSSGVVGDEMPPRWEYLCDPLEAILLAATNKTGKTQGMADACITVPADWTAEADLARFEALYGGSDDYFGDQLDRVFDEVDALEQVVDRVLVRYGIGQGETRDATINDKLLWLYRHVQSHTLLKNQRERLVDTLFYCTEVAGEFARLVTDCEDHPEQRWLAELMELCERLGQARLGLENAMTWAGADSED
jgi:hypothetical protein